MKIFSSAIKSIIFLLLAIFILQVGGLTCANDIYVTGPSVVQGKSLIKTADIKSADFDKGGEATVPGDLLYECQCPCHLNFSHIEPPTVASFWSTDSPLSKITKLYIPSLPGEILQPPQILT
ncbi:MAG: hypothetical protein BMS9Abin23_0318 [Thermodesulfobacteriota bacterium]|nr:MAG: hypothetical protein BMS9Abin23_0318 [Thermodesulfobacteriota bacterium]